MRFCRQRPRALGSAVTGKIWRNLLLNGEAVSRSQVGQVRDGGINGLLDGDGLPLVVPALPARGGKEQNLLDHGGQALALGANECAVLFNLRPGIHHAVRKVFRRGTNHTHRGAQLVRHAGHKIHLEPGKPLNALAPDED